MNYLENILNKVKEKIGKYTVSKENKEVEYKLEPKSTTVSDYERVVDLDGGVEDWYHDVGARGAFKS